MIGTHNRAKDDIDGVQGENIVAICDVDQNYLDAAQKRFPGAKQYKDFRKMLEQKDIDAVVIATPDHTHAVATVAALQSGRHVYCEKPLTAYDFRSANAWPPRRRRKPSLVTPRWATRFMPPITYRRVVEIVKSGVLGPVREVHCWQGSSYPTKPMPVGEPVPAGLNYDVWLGPVPYRPYSHEYLPFNWRGWWAFGGGCLSDFCCHLTDLAFWALDIKSPTTIEAEGPPVDKECPPPHLTVRYGISRAGFSASGEIDLGIIGVTRPSIIIPPKWNYGGAVRRGQGHAADGLRRTSRFAARKGF